MPTNHHGHHVIFGAGPVGRTLLDVLVSRGVPARIVNRSGVAGAPPGVDVRMGDVLASDLARDACQGASVVYNCLNPPYHLWPRLFPRLQQAVLDAAAQASAKLVAIENLYMYGSTNGQPMTEALPFRATTRKGRVRAAMADDLLRAHSEGRVRVAIGRASDFFGPRVRASAVGDRVFPAALRGKAMQVVGNPDLPHTYTYIRDIAQALALLGERDEALGRAWHIPSAATVTTRRFLELVAEETGTGCRVQVAPRWLLRLLGLINRDAGELVEMLYEFEEPFVVDHGEFERTFGLAPTPLRQAIRETIEWYR